MIKQHAPRTTSGSKEEIKICPETKNGNTHIKTCKDATKLVTIGKFLAINVYLKKQCRSQMNNYQRATKETSNPVNRKRKAKVRAEIRNKPFLRLFKRKDSNKQNKNKEGCHKTYHKYSGS